VPVLIDAPPFSEIEAVTEIFHGIPITDPYRWLEDQQSPRTRAWIAAQTRYARSYLDSIPGRDRIRDRIRELVDVETYDSVQKVGNRFFFRKRLRGQEQPCICVRDGVAGPDEVLIDPAQRHTGPHTAVKLLRISADGRLLLYEVKQGGERTGTFELFDIEKQEILPDKLSRGYLRGFAFSPDYKSFYYVHEATDSARPNYRAAYKHVLGTDLAEDGEAFFAGESERIRLHIIPGTEQMGLLVVHFSERTIIDFYLASLESIERPEPVIKNAEYRFGPTILADGRVLAITDYKAPNFRIVEVSPNEASEPDFRDVVPELDSPIQSWAVISDRVFVAYFRNLKTEVRIFDFSGKQLGQVPVDAADTIRLLPNGGNSDDLFFERESFTKPAAICSFSPASSEVVQWASRQIPFDSAQFDHLQVWFRSKDGTEIPMYLVGSRDVLERGQHPVIMTSYGGYGVSMTPQFSVFVAFLLERDCVFALPNIRGGSEYGIQWHEAAKRQKRQTAFDDFLSAAEWLITTGRTTPGRLALFGGSNSALLVAAAMTQRPDSFRAVVCMAPMLDMLRYHLFDNAHVWKDEFGTADDPEDFAALFRYSPYHNVHNGAEYPATMIISGDADQNCNPLHARKMAARLQAANGSDHQIILDYSRYRGHSPVLPLSERIESLTDRMAFLCDQLALQV
jgi:prolyl oligopeptidase